jgi:tetratricopeptide (TPR) repeat protein
VVLDRVVTQYPSSPHVATARLSRSALALRRQHESDALRDLDAVVRAAGPGVVEERRRLLEALAAPGTEAVVEAPPRRAAASADGHPLDRFAARILEPHHREPTPHVLHGLVVLTAADRGWHDAQAGALAGRLVEHFPTHGPAPALLARVATAAAAGHWPVARRGYETLLAHAPAALDRRARLGLGEALLRTGAAAPARAQLEHAAAAGGDEAARALLLLVELHSAAGDRRAALAAYDRLFQDHPRVERSAASLLAHARLLEELGQSERTRPVLRRAVEVSHGDVAAEAAYRLAQGLSADRQHAAAVEWYLTASYADPRSTWGLLALLGAGASLTALGETREALALYARLVPRAGTARPEDREVGGEAAYRAAEILRASRRHAEAREMFVTAAHLTAGRPAERRALLGLLTSLVATGDRAAAEAVYRRLQQAAAGDPQLLAQARQALQAGGPGANGIPESALPRTAR